MFIGTFVLLNLFLAIIVDAFLSQDVKEEDAGDGNYDRNMVEMFDDSFEHLFYI